MRRRDFITLLGGAAAGWPLGAWAQQPMPVIGVLRVDTPAASAGIAAAFRKGLSETGFVVGRNVAIKFRWGERPRSNAQIGGRFGPPQGRRHCGTGSAVNALAAKSATRRRPPTGFTCSFAPPTRISLPRIARDTNCGKEPTDNCFRYQSSGLSTGLG